MDDRELLEAAAKAAGIKLAPTGFVWDDKTAEMVEWNPLTDDGDALRLVVNQRMELVLFSKHVRASNDNGEDFSELYDSDAYAATRRAIVRAAAAIGSQA